MKKVLITIAMTAAITSLCWHIAIGVRHGIDQLWLISAVKAPGRMALEDIATELQRGNIATATAKLQIFKAEWSRFEADDKLSGAGIGNIMVEFSRATENEIEK